MKLGPAKLPKATAWDEAGKTKVVQILISHEDSIINSIQFAYAGTVEVHHSEIFGQPNSKQINVVTFAYPSEFLISVNGRYFRDRLVSIAFVTNKRMYGPFGAKEISTYSYNSFKFNYEFGAKCFGGFHGSVYDGHVFTIGVYVNPVKSLGELTV